MKDKKTKENILTAAAELFGRYGKEGVSTSDVSKAAKVNKALIFYYFNSKEELYLAVLKHWIDDITATLENTFAENKSGLDAIEAFIRAHIKFAGTHKNMVCVLMRELIENDFEPNDALKYFVQSLKNVRNDFLKAVSSARNAGEIRDVDPLQTIVNIISLDMFFFLGRPIIKLMNPLLDSDDFESERVDHVLDLIMYGLKKRPE